jgi:hypothetical protein
MYYSPFSGSLFHDRARQAKSKAREQQFYALVSKAKGRGPDAKQVRLADHVQMMGVFYSASVTAVLVWRIRIYRTCN